MEIKIGSIVKTYCLSDGEIAIGQIEHILDLDKEIECWRGAWELKYEGEKGFRTIKSNTIIWDKRERRYVFKYFDISTSCHTTIVVDSCEPDVALWRMTVSGEKIQNNLK